MRLCAFYFTGQRDACSPLCIMASPERGCGDASNSTKHSWGFCRVHELFALPRLVFVRPCGVCTRWRCVGAALLLSGPHDVCTAAAGFAGVTALAIAELSTTEAFAACTSCLLCRGLFSCAATVLVRDRDAWVQRRCSVGRMMCAQPLLDSQV